MKGQHNIQGILTV